MAIISGLATFGSTLARARLIATPRQRSRSAAARERRRGARGRARPLAAQRRLQRDDGRPCCGPAGTAARRRAHRECHETSYNSVRSTSRRVREHVRRVVVELHDVRAVLGPRRAVAAGGPGQHGQPELGQFGGHVLVDPLVLAQAVSDEHDARIPLHRRQRRHPRRQCSSRPPAAHELEREAVVGEGRRAGTGRRARGRARPRQRAQRAVRRVGPSSVWLSVALMVASHVYGSRARMRAPRPYEYEPRMRRLIIPDSN